MNREEILAKSRKEKNDEGLIAAEHQGRKAGVAALCLVFLVVVVFNHFTAQPNYTPMALFWAFFAAESYPKYRFTGNRSWLFTVICGALASLGFLVCHMLTALR